MYLATVTRHQYQTTINTPLETVAFKTMEGTASACIQHFWIAVSLLILLQGRHQFLSASSFLFVTAEGKCMLKKNFNWVGRRGRPIKKYGGFHSDLLPLESSPFSLRAVFGCDYVIHQGITIKEGGGSGVCAEGLEGNSGATDDHRLATAQGQECFVRRCVRQVARRR